MAQPAWLQWYCTGRCAWRQIQTPHDSKAKSYFARELGVVESSFDDDGRYYGGRADMCSLMKFQIPNGLTALTVRKRVYAVWSVLRAHHVLFRARAVDASQDEVLKGTNLQGRCFVLEHLEDARALYDDAARSIVFMDDFYDEVDLDLFLRDVMNTARCFDSKDGLSKLFVLPLEEQASGRYILTVVLVNAHMISDGITSYNVTSHFGNLLNFSIESNYNRLERLANDKNIIERLPPAQEELYPPLAPGNLARNRWHWAISRILRHVKKPTPAAFPNPLRRAQPRDKSQPMPPTLEKILDYNVTPPLNTFTAYTALSQSATKRLIRLCRESSVTFGSGCFTLVGLSMQKMYEEFYPSVPTEKRLHYVVGFPVNPRPLFKYSNSRDHGSCMLAFSDGLSLPFLPSDLPIEGRFKVLARQTHRQLNLYQKKPRSQEEMKQLGARSATELIPSTYLSTVERVEQKRPLEHRRGINPQGEYPASVSTSGYTNGVTAVGFRKALGVWDGNELSGSADEHVKVLDSTMRVRVRDNEFLVATYADPEVLHIGVSFDGNYIDEKKVERWTDCIKSLLEPEPSPSL